MSAWLIRCWLEDNQIKTTTIGPFESEAVAVEYVNYLPPEQRVSVTYRTVGGWSADYTAGEYMAQLWEKR